MLNLIEARDRSTVRRHTHTTHMEVVKRVGAAPKVFFASRRGNKVRRIKFDEHLWCVYFALPFNMCGAELVLQNVFHFLPLQRAYKIILLFNDCCSFIILCVF